jgi:predicted transcriptional regulator
MKTILREFLGDSPQVKVLDFFIDESIINNGWSIVEINKETGVSYSTLKKLIPKLVKKKILIIDKKVGNIKFYKLDKKNEAVLKMIQFDWALVKQETLNK